MLAPNYDSLHRSTSLGHSVNIFSAIWPAEAVEGAFGDDIDYTRLVKLYGDVPDSMKGKYSPAECAGALFMFYNFVRVHKTLKVSPAMAAGVSKLWKISDIVELMNAAEPAPAMRGPYRKNRIVLPKIIDVW